MGLRVKGQGLLLRVVTWIGVGLGGWDGGHCWFGVLLAEVVGKGNGMCRLGKGTVGIGVVRSIGRWYGEYWEVVW